MNTAKLFLTGLIIVFLTACTVPVSSQTQTITQNNNQPAEFEQNINQQQHQIAESKDTQNSEYYPVLYIVDGDTIDVEINGIKERIRIIGINSAEFNQDSCSAQYSKDKMIEIAQNRKVRLDSDPLSADRDVYNRLLRHLYLEDNTNIALKMLEQGDLPGFYNYPFSYEDEYKQAEAKAKQNKLGIWQDGFCQDNDTQDNELNSIIENTYNSNKINSFIPTRRDPTPTPLAPLPTIMPVPNSCIIKGNISYKTGEKIYHVPGCQSYSQTVITESKGERWFCTEGEAIKAGWRKAKNCP
jgi:micrococcal nuclease